ncbi:MAG TPA: dienelactone hydrolase family protein [Candidatus Acidoferrum sp.]|nr:dienelactone hydrolase family protein [Candidatus Acidoferrum sp.]
MAMRMRNHMVPAILAILTTSLPAAAQDKPAFVEIRQSEASFKSEGTSISAELFQPEAAGKYPAVIVLHGEDGMAFGRYPYVHIAASVARAGNVALIVRYFDRTDTPLATYWTQAQKIAAWRKTVNDAVTYAATLADVDANRIGLVGVSLGASLALALAAQDARVHAVVEYYGEPPDDFAAHWRKMPPVLILHGEKDSILKVDAAYRLEALLKKNQLPYEIKIYPGQGHGFQGADLADALARTIAFFRQHL